MRKRKVEETESKDTDVQHLKKLLKLATKALQTQKQEVKSLEKQMLQQKKILELEGFKEEMTCRLCKRVAFVPLVTPCCSDKLCCLPCIAAKTEEQIHKSSENRFFVGASCLFCQNWLKDARQRKSFYLQRYQLLKVPSQWNDRMNALLTWNLQSKEECPRSLRCEYIAQDYIKGVADFGVEGSENVMKQIWQDEQARPRRCPYCDQMAFTFGRNPLYLHLQKCEAKQLCTSKKCCYGKGFYRGKDRHFHLEVPKFEQLTSHVRDLIHSQMKKKSPETDLKIMNEMVMKLGTTLSREWGFIKHPADVMEKFYRAFNDAWQETTHEQPQKWNSNMYQIVRHS